MEDVNVKMILVNPEGKILLLHRDNLPHIAVPNKWSFVGGALEDGETPLEGAIRETKEEIGFEVKEAELFRVYQDKEIKRYVFVAAIDKDLKNLNLTEGDDLGFFMLEEALKLDLSGNTKRYIQDYFKTKELC